MSAEDHNEIVDRYIASGSFATNAKQRPVEPKEPELSATVVNCNMTPNDTGTGHLFAINDELLDDLSERNRGVEHTLGLLGEIASN